MTQSTSISISGTAIVEDDGADRRPDKFWASLVDNGWSAGNNAGNAQPMVKTTRGNRWKTETSTSSGHSTVCYAANKVIVTFINLDANTVRVGDTGRGSIEETGRDFTWRVESL